MHNFLAAVCIRIYIHIRDDANPLLSYVISLGRCLFANREERSRNGGGIYGGSRRGRFIFILARRCASQRLACPKSPKIFTTFYSRERATVFAASRAVSLSVFMVFSSPSALSLRDGIPFLLLVLLCTYITYESIDDDILLVTYVDTRECAHS